MQMPIVDGFSSTKMIRSFEKTQSSSCLSPRAKMHGRIPIFAVSASLEERDRERYVQTGFDGWILKPVDFKRVDLLLKGVISDEVRDTCIYEPGKWEQGGWFSKRPKSDAMFDVETTPNMEDPKGEAKKDEEEGRTSARDGTVTPTQEQQHRQLNNRAETI